MVSRGTLGVVFLLILVCVYLLSNRPLGSRQELEKQQGRYLQSLDSLEGEIIALRAKEVALIEKLTRGRDSLKTALNDLKTQRSKYAKIKPLIRPTDAQLDSAIARLYPR